jgi:zinc transporter, ZIP family
MMSSFWFALSLTVFAGMATGIGSTIAFMAKRTNYRFLSVATGFSAGVMLYVSFVEILAKAQDELVESYGAYWGPWINTGSFFLGMLIIGLIDALVPAAKNPHETHEEEELNVLHDPTQPLPECAPCIAKQRKEPDFDLDANKPHLLRMGIFTAIAIGIHNFPEGLVTFLAALEDPALGVAIAVAIALHNIPEGISVSVPIFYATGNRRKAFFYSFLSGLAEPVGALVGYFGIVLIWGNGSDIPSEIMGVLFSAVAGIMVYISLDELLPTSRAYGKGHDSLIGLVGGMVVMALSLLLMME